MLKNIMYTILALLVALFIYNTYIKEDEIIEVNMNNDMRMIGVMYNKDGYVVEADEQKDVESENKTYLTKARAYFEHTFIKGNEGVYDKNRKELLLKGEVYGKNEENSWEIFGEKLYYFEEQDLFVSDLPVKAFNGNRKLTIRGNYFESDSNISNLLLRGSVYAYDDNYDIYSDKAYYSDSTGILNLEGNVRATMKEGEREGKTFSEVTGYYPKAIYDTNTGVLTSSGNNVVYYEGYEIKGNSLLYEQEKGIMTLEENVVVKKEDLEVKFLRGILNQNTNILTLYGRVEGEKEGYKFYGDKAYINIQTEDIEVEGNVEVVGEKENIVANKAYFEKAKDLLKIYGEGKNVVYTSGERKFRADYAEYYNSENKLLIPGEFDFEGVDDQKQKYTGTGKNLIFFTDAETGTLDIPYIEREDNNFLKGVKGIFDFSKAYHRLEGEVVGAYGDYDLESTNVEIDQNKEIVYLNEEFVAKNRIDGSVIRGKKGIANNKSKMLTSDSKSYYSNNEVKANGNNLVYNFESEEGRFEGDVYAYSIENEMTITGNRATFKNGDYINIYGDVLLSQGDYRSKTDEINYKEKEAKAYFPKENYMWSNINDIETKSSKGYYDLNERIFVGDEYWGRSNISESKSDYVEYYVDKEMAILKGNVEVEDKEMEMIIKTDELHYFRATDYALSPGKLNIIRNNILLEASSGNSDLKAKRMELKDPVLTTTNGDRIVGDRMYGDYFKNEFDFAGNIDGKVFTVNEAQLKGLEEVDYGNPLKFSGKLAKVYFVEDDNEEFFVTRSEIKDESKFYYKDMVLEGDFLEAQGSSQKLFAKGNSVITVQEINKIGAESIILDMTTEEAYMEGNVTITSTSQEAGGINTRSDKAFFNNSKSTIDLEGNIESYKGKTKFVADTGVFDLESNKLAGKGNIFLSMDFETATEADDRKEKEEKAKAKIAKAKEEVDIPSEITSEIEYLELLRQFEEVIIAWQSSNEEYINLNGDIFPPNYDERDVFVKLTASYILDETSEKVDYYIRVFKEDKNSYLNKWVLVNKPIYNQDENKIIVDFGEDKPYNLKISNVNDEILSKEGEIIAEDILNKEFKITYYLEDISIEKTFVFVEENMNIGVKEVEEEVKAIEEHSST